MKVTCQSRRFNNPIVEKVDPRGRKYYWIAGTRQSWSRQQDADHEALARHMVSVTPIRLDTTHHHAGALQNLGRDALAPVGGTDAGAPAFVGEASVMSGLIEWLIEVLGRFVIATISTFGTPAS